MLMLTLLTHFPLHVPQEFVKLTKKKTNMDLLQAEADSNKSKEPPSVLDRFKPKQKQQKSN